MDATAPPHPADRTLRAYGLGKLDDPSDEAVNRHLDACPDCCRRVAGLSPDSFLARLRETGVTPDPSAAGRSRAAATEVDPERADGPSAGPIPPELADHPNYSIRRELGRGGMGVVYLANNRLMGRDEVLKVVGGHLVERPGMLDRFLREIRSAARLHHPNIVTAYAAFRSGESIVLAMEYVDGLDLARIVQDRGMLPVADACCYAQQAAAGAAGRPRAGYGPPRHQAGQPDPGPRRAPGGRQGARFRPGKGDPRGLRRWLPDPARSNARHPRFHRAGADPRRPGRRHPRRRLQPGLHALLPAQRRPAVPGRGAVRPAPGPSLDGREALELDAGGRAGGVGGAGCQDDGQGSRGSIPDARRGRPCAHAVLRGAARGLPGGGAGESHAGDRGRSGRAARGGGIGSTPRTGHGHAGGGERGPGATSIGRGSGPGGVGGPSRGWPPAPCSSASASPGRPSASRSGPGTGSSSWRTSPSRRRSASTGIGWPSAGPRVGAPWNSPSIPGGAASR